MGIPAIIISYRSRPVPSQTHRRFCNIRVLIVAWFLDYLRPSFPPTARLSFRLLPRHLSARSVRVHWNKTKEMHGALSRITTMRPSQEAKPAAILRTIETVAPFFPVHTAVTTPAWVGVSRTLQRRTQMRVAWGQLMRPHVHRTRKTGIAGN